MAYKAFVVALSVIWATSAGSTPNPDPRPLTAPPGTAETRYCMRVEAITGSRIETVRCWTRAEWAEQDVDVDQEWAKEGVRVIG
ncbi:MAG: hypothetical protein ACJ8EP_05615 [Sphingomicrobium sp.]|jgi:hypothetical protein